MPDYVPISPRDAVVYSGFAEIAGRTPRWALWARLPLQPLMVWWVWRATAR